ncbi:M14 family metallopeptidase [Planctomycetota bacterium]
MFQMSNRRKFVSWLLLIVLITAFCDLVQAQRRRQGGRGAQARSVPIDFNDFHGYTGTVEYLKAVAQANPNLTDLLEIGKSTLGRPMYVLVISNMQTGTTIDAHVELRNMRKENVKNVPAMKPYQGKPGHWLGGATHGNEFTGTEVCLFTIDKLISGYGSDPQIRQLVDDTTFYICPIINPDGVYNSVEGDISQRQNSELKDDDGDGKINEDGPDDLNGDGHITQFRYRDPEGQYVIDDVDPRLMVRLGRDEETTEQRYSVVTEDKDNDGDDRRGEDGERGIDLNRNFPEGWMRDDGLPGGSGLYATSAPETQAVCEFFTNHTNILMAQFYHTSGGFTYRPIGTEPDTGIAPRDLAILDFIMGKKYLEMIGEEVPEAWLHPEDIDKFKAEMEAAGGNQYDILRGYKPPRGWRPSYNENSDQRYSYGMATSWAYKQFGAYSITTELWNSGKDMKGIGEFTGADANVQRERALLKYQDEEFGGKFFIPWTRFTHPELGRGEIGGWIPRYRGGNAFPGASLEGVCQIHCDFELFRAGLLPKVVVAEAQAKVLYTVDAGQAQAIQQNGQVTINKNQAQGEIKIVEVTATIENTGKLPTHLENGSRLAGNRADVVWLVTDRDKVTFLEGGVFQQIGVLDGTMEIPGYTPAQPTPAAPAAGMGQGGQRMQQMMQQMGQRQRGQRQLQVQAGQRQRGQRQPGQRQRGQRGQAAGAQEPAPPAPNQRQVRWLIAVEGDVPLKVIASSQRGGTDVEELTIR